MGVEVGVADAGVGGDGDAGAELAALASDGGERGDAHRFVGLQDGSLAGVAFGVGVGDVVAGDVDRLLLGEQAGEGGLESLEGGDGHGRLPRYAWRSSTRSAPWRAALAPVVVEPRGS